MPSKKFRTAAYCSGIGKCKDGAHFWSYQLRRDGDVQMLCINGCGKGRTVSIDEAEKSIGTSGLSTADVIRKGGKMACDFNDKPKVEVLFQPSMVEFMSWMERN